MTLDPRWITGTLKDLKAVEDAVADVSRAVDGHRALLDDFPDLVDANRYLEASLSLRRAAGTVAEDLEKLVSLLEAYEPNDDHPALPVTAGTLSERHRRMGRRLHEIAMGLMRLTGHPRARIGGPGESLGKDSPAVDLLEDVRRLGDRLGALGLRILDVTDPGAASFRRLRR